MKYFLLLVLALVGCGGGETEEVATPSCRVVHMYGDSITRQAGQTIKQFIPCHTVVNHGVNGSMARQMSIPAWDKEAVYTISYGANECLKNIPIATYRDSLNHILNAGIGQRMILEAPWRLVNPACSPRIDQYRAVVVELGAKYNVPVAKLDINQDHDGGGIHFKGSAHETARAKLLSVEILKF